MDIFVFCFFVMCEFILNEGTNGRRVAHKATNGELKGTIGPRVVHKATKGELKESIYTWLC